MTVAPATDTQELLRMAIGPACHELRSPLAVVYGFARMLEGSNNIDEAATAKYVGQIVRSAERLDHMLDDLSKIGRIAASRLHPQTEHVPLRSIVDDLCATSTNEGRLSVDPGADVSVRADPAWLTEALQATVDGLCFEEGIDVRITWRHLPHEVQLHVVPNSSFPMIDVEPEKSGLGVSLARMRIVAMGGSFEGSGDRIVVTLPRA
ncbi:MAG: two-component sensor histidine kinase [Thermoleophilia bacterium]|nr:two-component sensor histidine kinase [Thermoleophilia bacterium]